LLLVDGFAINAALNIFNEILSKSKNLTQYID